MLSLVWMYQKYCIQNCYTHQWKGMDSERSTLYIHLINSLDGRFVSWRDLADGVFITFRRMKDNIIQPTQLLWGFWVKMQASSLACEPRFHWKLEQAERGPCFTLLLLPFLIHPIVIVCCILHWPCYSVEDQWLRTKNVFIWSSTSEWVNK